MINLDELDENFTSQDRYLVAEHLAHGTDDFLLTSVGDEHFVVPYKYRLAGRDEKEAIGLFKKDLLDFQTLEAEKYKKAGIQVRTETYDGVNYVVPFQSREQNVSPMKLAQYVSAMAAKKYNTVVGTHQELSQKRDVGNTDFSMRAAEYYLALNEKEQARAKAGKIMEVKQAADKATGKRSNVFGLSAEEISRQASRLAQRTWKAAQRHGKAVGVSTLIGLSALGGLNLFNRSCSENSGREGEPLEQTTPSNRYSYTRQGDIYIDFMGTEHSDSLGNISRIMELKPEISAMLIAVEGYSDRAYRDGVGQETIGSGITFFLNDDGNPVPVEMGQRTTPDEAMKQKWRFIEKEMLPLLGDNLGRKCDDGELKACIGAGFCWGKNAFRKSDFYKSVKNGASKAEQARKLTGFRKQRGLLKRSYVLSACLLGQWNGRELLDLPIYYLPRTGYLACAPYSLELHEIMPCQTDATGKYKKDKLGNDVPLIAADGFGAFYNNYKHMHQKMCEKAVNGDDNYRCVRSFMPEDMLNAIHYNKETLAFTEYHMAKNAQR